MLAVPLKPFPMRAEVEFNPVNSVHRNFYLEFMLTGRWPDEPFIRFKLDKMYPSVPTMCYHKTLNYYFITDGYITEKNIKMLVDKIHQQKENGNYLQNLTYVDKEGIR